MVRGRRGKRVSEGVDGRSCLSVQHSHSLPSIKGLLLRLRMSRWVGRSVRYGEALDAKRGGVIVSRVNVMDEARRERDMGYPHRLTCLPSVPS